MTSSYPVPFYSVAEAAKMTRMSQAWWRQQIFMKRVKHLKIGRRVFIPKETIQKILEDAVVEPFGQGIARAGK